MWQVTNGLHNTDDIRDIQSFTRQNPNFSLSVCGWVAIKGFKQIGHVLHGERFETVIYIVGYCGRKRDWVFVEREWPYFASVARVILKFPARGDQVSSINQTAEEQYRLNSTSSSLNFESMLNQSSMD